MRKVWDEKSNEGQAIFEFVIFLPFLLIIFYVMIMLGSSINGSINQQKTVRAYFFYLNKNNSTLPGRSDMIAYEGRNIKNISSVAYGWREKFLGGVGTKGEVLAPCYKVGLFKTANSSASCEEAEKGQVNYYIKPKTVFGICSSGFNIKGEGKILYVANPLLYNISLEQSCKLESGK